VLSDVYKFLDLVREYNNGEEIYDRLMQILKDYGEQRLFLSSAFSFANVYISIFSSILC
jgi:hypothetical protein